MCRIRFTAFNKRSCVDIKKFYFFHYGINLNNIKIVKLFLIYYFPAAVASGFLRTRMTESPRRNIFGINLSLFTGFAFFLPFPVRGNSVHISFTFSKTMLQCLSKAFTRPNSFLLFLQFINTWVLFLTDCVRTERGPVLNSSSSLFANSSGVISDFGFVKDIL